MIKFCVILTVYGLFPLLTQSSPTGEIEIAMAEKEFYFSHYKIEPREGASACEKAFPRGDGQVISLEDEQKAKTFERELRYSGNFAGTYYWTSAFCKRGQYVWESNGNPVDKGNYLLWEDGTPNSCNDNYKVAIKREDGELKIALFQSTDEKKIACEKK